MEQEQTPRSSINRRSSVAVRPESAGSWIDRPRAQLAGADASNRSLFKKGERILPFGITIVTSIETAQAVPTWNYRHGLAVGKQKKELVKKC